MQHDGPSEQARLVGRGDRSLELLEHAVQVGPRPAGDESHGRIQTTGRVALDRRAPRVERGRAILRRARQADAEGQEADPDEQEAILPDHSNLVCS